MFEGSVVTTNVMDCSCILTSFSIMNLAWRGITLFWTSCMAKWLDFCKKNGWTSVKLRYFVVTCWICVDRDLCRKEVIYQVGHTNLFICELWPLFYWLLLFITILKNIYGLFNADTNNISGKTSFTWWVTDVWYLCASWESFMVTNTMF